jgi:excinuclease ABC subunit B
VLTIANGIVSCGIIFLESLTVQIHFRERSILGSFTLATHYAPEGDQPKAIADILESLATGATHHVLLGVTGSGKTFTMANVIASLGKPTLIIAPNKTLAAQLFSELKGLFPENAVEFFISYYDYYQPEAYVPSSDTYIAKDASINDDIDKMRHSATRTLFERKDVIIVASVSCIYGLGSPSAYSELMVSLTRGADMGRNELLSRLVDIQYSRNDISLLRGHFRVRGDVVDILPSHKRNEALRVEFFGDEVERLSVIDGLTGDTLRAIEEVSIYPNSHYVTDRRDIGQIVKEILKDLGVRLRELKAQGKLVEYQRLEQRTMHDVETLEQLGFCPGIENYSRYLNGLPEGHPPPTLLDYFPENFLTIIDESHITNPQVGGMFRGDRARKQNLVDYGFRLPSALDNRPLNFDEFLARNRQILHVSATPGPFEIQASAGRITEQVIRPTGLIDPKIIVKPEKNQVDDLYGEIRALVEAPEKDRGRVLVTTLTKRMAEDLTRHYLEMGLKVKYLHSDIDALMRVDLLRGLRKGDFDVLVGINLLREGLDLPEVRLVAVLDADKEGFLRSKSSLIQVVGRAARNVHGKVIFYGERVTESMRACIEETERRRVKQLAYNKKMNITPQTIIKDLPEDLRVIYGLEQEEPHLVGPAPDVSLQELGLESVKELDQLIRKKTKAMQRLAQELEFEKAASIRDELTSLRNLMLNHGEAAEAD